MLRGIGSVSGGRANNVQQRIDEQRWCKGGSISAGPFARLPEIDLSFLPIVLPWL